MRTKEFIKRVEELGFGTWITGNTVYISKGNDKIMARVEVHKTLSIDFVYPSNRSLEEEIRKKLFDLVVEYASTPIEDREEEKKLYLKHRWLVQAGDYEMGFLNYDTCNDMLFIYSEHHTNYVKTQFTLKEIEELKEKFDTDLSDFELVEVEE